MLRREFIGLIGGAATFPFAVHAQHQKTIARIGFLMTASLGLPEGRAALDAFLQGMRELGYVKGENLLIEVREAHSDIERFPALAKELVQLNVDVIVALNSPAARAVQRASAAVPTVVPVMGDPVGDGLVASLARPGGNITGQTFLGPALVPKRLALLKEALPMISRVAALWHPGAYGDDTMKEMAAETDAAAATLGLQLKRFTASAPEQFDTAFSAVALERADALLEFPSPMFFAERKHIVDLTTKYRLPSMSVSREFVTLGGLLSYGANVTEAFRLSAIYVDKILKGARPADLPVQQPTKFELCVNLKTAKAIGVTMPSTLLARADEVIE